jgi:HAD superfamily phosphoserine phosphatase-like hydrolase
MPSKISRIAAFDLDGTLLRGPTVCEVLAKPLGRLEEMRRFEACTTEPELTEARLEMAQWYCNHTVPQLQQHLCNAQWAPGAYEAIERLRRGGVEVAIVSVTWSFAVQWFAQQLNVFHYFGTELLPNGEIVHSWGREKARFLRELVVKHGVASNRVAAIGDSSGDIEMLREASLRFFLGANPPSDIEGIIHLPSGDIGTVAAHILTEWA